MASTAGGSARHIDSVDSAHMDTRVTSCLFLRGGSDVRGLEGSWDDLSINAVEPNVFYERWMLMPALKFLNQARGGVYLILIWAESPGMLGERKLIGLFPMEHRFGYCGVPVWHLTSFQYAQCFLGTPLIRKGCEEECVLKFFEFVDKAFRHLSLIEFRQFCADGKFAYHLKEAAQSANRSYETTASYKRGFLFSDTSPHHYFEKYSAKQRKEFRRKTKRLAELGQIRISILSEKDDSSQWADDFMKLEQSGWKGQAASALAAKQSTRDFFNAVAAEAFQRGQLDMVKLCVDDKPIAMQCNFISGEGSFAFKIAYDENYASCSPGTLLSLEIIRHVLTHARVSWMDSCAAPDSLLINTLWFGRRTISTVQISAKNCRSRIVMKLLSLIRRFCRGLHTISVDKNFPAIF